MHTIAISHGEGRFVASDDVLAQLKANGQIATQYVDEAGVPGMDLDVKPERFAVGHRRHHQPGRPRVRQDGPLRALQQRHIRERAWREGPAAVRGRRGVLRRLSIKTLFTLT